MDGEEDEKEKKKKKTTIYLGPDLIFHRHYIPFGMVEFDIITLSCMNRSYKRVILF